MKNTLRKALVLLPILATGCQSYYFDFTQGVTVKATSMTTAVYNTTPTDVLFVIDNSGTMSEEQTELINSTEKFITAMAESPNKFRMGVISTDTIHYPYNSGMSELDNCCMHISYCQSIPGRCEADGAICGPDDICHLQCKADSDCMTGEKCNMEEGHCEVVITCEGTVPNFCGHGQLRSATGRPYGKTEADEERWFMEYPKSEAERKQLVTDFQNTIKALGTKGSTFEAGLQAMVYALDGRNPGFPRKDADLAVIFVTDEDDCSLAVETGYHDWEQEDCYNENSSKLENIEKYVAKLVELKGDISRVRVAGIIGSMPWQASDLERPEPALGYYASGCYQQGVNGASNDCCCLTGEVTNMNTPADDLYCRLMTEDPYSQPFCLKGMFRSPIQPGQEYGGCTAMPGSRYLKFLELVSQNRTQAGLMSDTLVDSVCAAGYQETLLKIVNSVILNDCFTLEKHPQIDDADHPENSLMVELNGQKIPYSADGKAKGWRYAAGVNQVCLTGGLHKNLNDEFNITIITSSSGSLTDDIL